MADRKITVILAGDADSLNKAFGHAGAAAGEFEKKTGGALSNIATIGAGVVAGGLATKLPGIITGLADTSAALELQAAKAKVVFGDQLPIVQAWAAGSAKAMGLTRSEAVNLAAGMQDLLVPMGFTRDEAAKMSAGTLELAGALSEWTGGTMDAKAVSDILTKAMLGERDGLKALGISISEADVKARLAANGTDKLTGAALAQATALATQQLIIEKSTDAQTAFANGAGSAARKQAEMSAATKEGQEALANGFGPAIAEVQALLASVLIPALELVPPIMDGIGAAVGFVAEHFDIIGPILAGVGVAILAGMVPALLTAIPVVLAHAAGWIATAAAVVVANAPFIAVAVVIGLVVAAILLLITHWDDITAKVPILGTAFDAVKEGVQRFIDWITGPFSDGVGKVVTIVSGAFTGAIDWVRQNWDKFQEPIETVLKAVKVVFETSFAQIQTVLETAFGVIEGIVDIFAGIFTGDFDRVKKGVLGIFTSLKDGVMDTLGNLITLITGLAPLFLAAAKGLGTAFLDGMKSALTGAAGFVSDVGEALLRGVKGILNGVIDQFNRLVEFEIPLPFGQSFTVDPPDIPHLAKGGIVVAGDNPSGIEAIVPLERAREMGFGGGGGDTINIHITATDTGDVMRQIDRTLRLQGRKPVFAT